MNASNPPSIFARFKTLIATPDLPELGPQARSTRLPASELDAKVERFLAETGLTASIHPLVSGAALLWHDHLDASHAISQQIHSPEGSFLHGIMHRREPDGSNAKYWFHRVGNHPCYPDIAKQVTRLIAATDEQRLASILAPRGDWDPFAFVDACEEAIERAPSAPRVHTLKAIQQIEFDCLLAHVFAK